MSASTKLATKQAQPTPDGKAMRILLIDDERNIKRTLTMALQAEGHEVVAVESSSGALRQVQKAPFDVAFLDLRLGQEDGLEVLTQLRRADVGMAVVICATADNLSAGQQAAFVRYMSEEGFVSGALIELASRTPGRCPDCDGWPVRWIVDPTWPEIDPVYARHLQRLCWYTAGCMIAWLALMTVVICC